MGRKEFEIRDFVKVRIKFCREQRGNSFDSYVVYLTTKFHIIFYTVLDTCRRFYEPPNPIIKLRSIEVLLPPIKCIMGCIEGIISSASVVVSYMSINSKVRANFSTGFNCVLARGSDVLLLPTQLLTEYTDRSLENEIVIISPPLIRVYPSLDPVFSSTCL